MSDLLAGIAAVSEELRCCLDKRDDEVARTAARLWGRLNDELVRVTPEVQRLQTKVQDLETELRQVSTELNFRRGPNYYPG